VTVCNIYPQDIALDGCHKSVDARIQDDFIVNRNRALKRLALFHAAALRTKQQKVHGSKNGAKEEQSEQWIPTVI
jgi:hypothetical protein